MTQPTNPTTTTTLQEMFGMNIIHSYSRTQALADGALVACDEQLAREAGFTLPLAFSAAVEALITEIPEAYGHEDETGRRWDVLVMANRAARVAKSAHLVPFKVIVHHDTPSRSEAAHTHELFVQIGPGDLGKPVLTVMTSLDL